MKILNQETVVLHKFTRGDKTVKICPFCDVENAASRSSCFICGRNLSDAFVANDYSEIVMRGPYPDPQPEEVTPPKTAAKGYGKLTPSKPVDKHDHTSPKEKSDGGKWIIGIATAIVVFVVIALIFGGCTASATGFADLPSEDAAYADGYTVIADDNAYSHAVKSICESTETVFNNISA